MALVSGSLWRDKVLVVSALSMEEKVLCCAFLVRHTTVASPSKKTAEDALQGSGIAACPTSAQPARARRASSLPGDLHQPDLDTPCCDALPLPTTHPPLSTPPPLGCLRTYCAGRSAWLTVARANNAHYISLLCTIRKPRISSSLPSAAKRILRSTTSRWPPSTRPPRVLRLPLRPPLRAIAVALRAAVSMLHRF